MITPQVKTSIAVAVPIVLLGLHFFFPHVTSGDVTVVLGGVVAVAQAVQGILNVFHVSAKTKGVLADVTAAAVEAKADIPADTLAEANRLSDVATKPEEKKS